MAQMKSVRVIAVELNGKVLNFFNPVTPVMPWEALKIATRKAGEPMRRVTVDDKDLAIAYNMAKRGVVSERVLNVDRYGMAVAQ